LFGIQKKYKEDIIRSTILHSLNEGIIKTNTSEETPIYVSIKQKRKIIEQLLIQKQIHFEMKNKNEIHWVYKNDHIQIKERFTQKNQLDLKLKQQNDQFLFFWACKNNNLKIVKFLLNEKLIKIEKKNEFGDNGLIIAIMEGHRNIVELLIQNGANVNATNSTNKSCLKLALELNHYNILELLFDYGAIYDSKTRDYSLLMVASKYGYIKLVRLLIQKGADIHLTNFDGEDCLMLAAQEGHWHIVEV
jgi:ankyrin repeat protein